MIRRLVPSLISALFPRLPPYLRRELCRRTPHLTPRRPVPLLRLPLLQAAPQRRAAPLLLQFPPLAERRVLLLPLLRPRPPNLAPVGPRAPVLQLPLRRLSRLPPPPAPRQPSPVPQLSRWQPQIRLLRSRRSMPLLIRLLVAPIRWLLRTGLRWSMQRFVQHRLRRMLAWTEARFTTPSLLSRLLTSRGRSSCRLVGRSRR